MCLSLLTPHPGARPVFPPGPSPMMCERSLRSRETTAVCWEHAAPTVWLVTLSVRQNEPFYDRRFIHLFFQLPAFTLSPLPDYTLENPFPFGKFMASFPTVLSLLLWNLFWCTERGGTRLHWFVPSSLLQRLVAHWLETPPLSQISLWAPRLLLDVSTFPLSVYLSAFNLLRCL